MATVSFESTETKFTRVTVNPNQMGGVSERFHSRAREIPRRQCPLALDRGAAYEIRRTSLNSFLLSVGAASRLSSWLST
jgi:hypothetical protein